MIQKYGEVSEPVASELATQANYFWKTHLGLGVTGIAGPAGATAEKPIGLVYIAIAEGPRVKTEKHIFWGNREQIQRKAVSKALEMLWRHLVS